MLDKLKYIILGIIQGLTEPLPISSSGHLVIFKNLFNLDSLNDLNFEIIVNFASFLAISFIYRKNIIKLIKDSINYLKTKNYKYENSFKYILLIILACIPAGILGLLFKDKIDLISTNVKYIGIALLITSLALFIVRKIDGKKHDNDITYKDSIIIGLFQGIALLPGISRSGSTLTGGLLRNIKKEDAVKFSFMLYLPISIASFILGIKDFTTSNNFNNLYISYILSFIFSFIATYFATKWFINIIKKKKLIYFSIYCFIVGLLVLIFM